VALPLPLRLLVPLLAPRVRREGVSPYLAVQGVVAECIPLPLPLLPLPFLAPALALPGPAAEDFPLRRPDEDSPLPAPPYARALRGRMVGKGARTLIGLGIVLRLMRRAAAREAAIAMGSAVVCVALDNVGTGLRFKLMGMGTGADSVFMPSCFSGVVFADVAGVVVAVVDALAFGLVVALELVMVPTRGVSDAEPGHGPVWTTGLCALIFLNAGWSAKSGARRIAAAASWSARAQRVVGGAVAVLEALPEAEVA